MRKRGREMGWRLGREEGVEVGKGRGGPGVRLIGRERGPKIGYLF